MKLIKIKQIATTTLANNPNAENEVGFQSLIILTESGKLYEKVWNGSDGWCPCHPLDTEVAEIDE
jgi:hypothetical protein